MFYEIDISSISRTHKFELEFFFQVDILLILGGFQKNVSIFLDLLDPFPLVSNFIVYNLEILLSYVSILRTSLLPLGADVICESPLINFEANNVTSLNDTFLRILAPLLVFI